MIAMISYHFKFTCSATYVDRTARYLSERMKALIALASTRGEWTFSARSWPIYSNYGLDNASRIKGDKIPNVINHWSVTVFKLQLRAQRKLVWDLKPLYPKIDDVTGDRLVNPDHRLSCDKIRHISLPFIYRPIGLLTNRANNKPTEYSLTVSPTHILPNEYNCKVLKMNHRKGMFASAVFWSEPLVCLILCVKQTVITIRNIWHIPATFFRWKGSRWIRHQIRRSEVKANVWWRSETTSILRDHD